MAKIKVKLDALDFRAVMNAMEAREETGMPYGGGNKNGRLIAEICRGWMEMRSAPAVERIQPPDMPRIVCLCGSTRFYDVFQKANYEETMAGRIVLSVGFYPHTPGANHGEGVGHDSAEKVALDELHKRKIDLADEVLVLNVGGYVGSSTKSEIEYAALNGKPIRWLEPKAFPSPNSFVQESNIELAS